MGYRKGELLTQTQKESICCLMNTGLNIHEIAHRFRRTPKYMYRVYQDTTGQGISFTRPLGEGKVRNIARARRVRSRATQNRAASAEFLSRFHFEEFDEQGWENFGMIVIE